ncbi:MAG: hypothetical protein ACREIT_02295 [Tepidisphaeraceae bacterium]
MIAIATFALNATAGTIVVELPEGLTAKSATLADRDARPLPGRGAIDGQTVRFQKLESDTPHSIVITLADGGILHGADLSWHNEEPANPEAGAMTQDDLAQVNAIVTDVQAFTNKHQILHLRGDHERAVAVLQLVRDREFHADKGGEIIWRIEIWYFRNNNGGWEKERQLNRILRRERFGTREGYDAATKPVKWVPELGGIVLSDEQPSVTVKLPSTAGTPTPGGTASSESTKPAE